MDSQKSMSDTNENQWVHFKKKKKTIVGEGKRTDTRKIVEGSGGESEVDKHVENSQLKWCFE